jgi:signal transduction histidine kinase
MGRLSLRARVLLGAILWTAGLFVFAAHLATAVMIKFPSAPRVFHAMFAHAASSSIIAVICMLAGFWQVRRGLTPLHQLRERLAAVHSGRDRRVDGAYPSEVQPLVNDLNALLEHRERVVDRALAKAGDLAHGLKTPLAVLSHEAECAEAAGEPDLAKAIAQQVDRMRRQIDYHLAHARAAASGPAPGVQCAVAASADGLARTLLRLHADRGLSIDVNVPPDHLVRAQREDVDEMLGNLLDNACKWARSRILVSSARVDGTIVITVDDDGRGVDASMRDVVLQRGVRADQAASGSGFGLAIVRDLAEVYGGAIALDRSPAGGLRATLSLPSVSDGNPSQIHA